MRVLFVNQHTGSATFPLASAALASSLEYQFGATVHCDILEPPPDFDVQVLVRDITAMKPDLIALTLYVWSRNRLLELAAAFRGLPDNRRPVIIAGGPEVTACAAEIQADPAIDLAVAGEGEEAIIRIVSTLLNLEPAGRFAQLATLPAPWFAPPVEQLDSLSSPWEALALKDREYEDTVWELTRGCPFSCHFCYESRGRGGVRHKSPKRVREELDQIRRRGAEKVFILDPTFNASRPRAVEILELLISEAPELSFHMEIRTEFLDEEQAGLYAELGCTLQVGLQTSDPVVARNIGRPFSPEDFREKLLLLHEYGVPYGLDLIYGLPGDSLDGFRRSLDFALGCAPNHLDLFPLSILPGTRLRDDAASIRLNHMMNPPYTVTGGEADDGFMPEDLVRSGELAGAADGLYNRGRAVPWFLTITENLDTGPAEVIDAYREFCSANPWASTGIESEEDRPSYLGTFVHHLSERAGREELGGILADIVILFTLESAYRENLPLPEVLNFTRKPDVLLEHLEMGITGIDELCAFVPEAPGTYEISISMNGYEDDGLLTFRLLN